MANDSFNMFNNAIDLEVDPTQSATYFKTLRDIGMQNQADLIKEKSMSDFVLENDAVSPYQKKFLNALTSFEEKKKIVDRIGLTKSLNIDGFQSGIIQRTSDGDSITYIDAQGNIKEGRLSDFDMFDAADSKRAIDNSRFKTQNQLKYLSSLTGKAIEDLNDFDFENVKNWSQNQTVRAFSEHETPFEKYDPSKIYSPTDVGQMPFLYKEVGTDSYGRTLLEAVNPYTKRSVSFDLTMNPYLDTSFDLYKAINTKYNRKRMSQYVRDTETLSDEAARSLDDLIDGGNRFGETLDIVQSTAYSSVARLLQHDPTGLLDNKKWRDIANAETGQRIADAWAGVKKSTRVDQGKKMLQASKDWENGNYIEAISGWATQIDRLFAESAVQMGLMVVGNIAGRAIGAVAGGAVGAAGGPIGAAGGALVGAFLGGGILASLDMTLSSLEEYKANNNGEEMPADEVASLFATNVALTVPETLLLKLNLTKLFPKSVNKALGNAYQKLEGNPLTHSLKTVGTSAVGEGLQEYAQTATETYFTQNRENAKSLAEVLTDTNTVQGGVIGSLMGGSMSATGAVAGMPAKVIAANRAMKQEELNAATEKYESEHSIFGEEIDSSKDTETKATFDDLTKTFEATSNKTEEEKNKTGEPDYITYIKNLSNLYDRSLSISSEKNLSEIYNATLSAATDYIASKPKGSEERKEAIEKIKEVLSPELSKAIFQTYVNGTLKDIGGTRGSSPSAVWSSLSTEQKEEIYKVGEDFGLTKEEVEATIETVHSDVLFGRRGVYAYLDIANKAIKRLKEVSTDDEAATQLNKSVQSLSNLFQNQADKVTKFIDALNKLNSDTSLDVVTLKEFTNTDSGLKDFVLNKFDLLRPESTSENNGVLKLIKSLGIEAAELSKALENISLEENTSTLGKDLTDTIGALLATYKTNSLITTLNDNVAALKNNYIANIRSDKSTIEKLSKYEHISTALSNITKAWTASNKKDPSSRSLNGLSRKQTINYYELLAIPEEVLLEAKEKIGKDPDLSRFKKNLFTVLDLIIKEKKTLEQQADITSKTSEEVLTENNPPVVEEATEQKEEEKEEGNKSLEEKVEEKVEEEKVEEVKEEKEEVTEEVKEESKEEVKEETVEEVKEESEEAVEETKEELKEEAEATEEAIEEKNEVEEAKKEDVKEEPVQEVKEVKEVTKEEDKESTAKALIEEALKVENKEDEGEVSLFDFDEAFNVDEYLSLWDNPSDFIETDTDMSEALSFTDINDEIGFYTDEDFNVDTSEYMEFIENSIITDVGADSTSGIVAVVKEGVKTEPAKKHSKEHSSIISKTTNSVLFFNSSNTPFWMYVDGVRVYFESISEAYKRLSARQNTGNDLEKTKELLKDIYRALCLTNKKAFQTLMSIDKEEVKLVYTPSSDATTNNKYKKWGVVPTSENTFEGDNLIGNIIGEVKVDISSIITPTRKHSYKLVSDDILINEDKAKGVDFTKAFKETITNLQSYFGIFFVKGYLDTLPLELCEAELFNLEKINKHLSKWVRKYPDNKAVQEYYDVFHSVKNKVLAQHLNAFYLEYNNGKQLNCSVNTFISSYLSNLLNSFDTSITHVDLDLTKQRLSNLINFLKRNKKELKSSAYFNYNKFLAELEVFTNNFSTTDIKGAKQSLKSLKEVFKNSQDLQKSSLSFIEDTPALKRNLKVGKEPELTFVADPDFESEEALLGILGRITHAASKLLPSHINASNVAGYIKGHSKSAPHLSLMYDVKKRKVTKEDGKVGYKEVVELRKPIFAVLDASLGEFLSTFGEEYFKPQTTSQLMKSIGRSPEEADTLLIKLATAWVKKNGVLMDNIAQQLGTIIMHNLGLSSDKENGEVGKYETISKGLGVQALLYGQALGYFKINTGVTDDLFFKTGKIGVTTVKLGAVSTRPLTTEYETVIAPLYKRESGYKSEASNRPIKGEPSRNIKGLSGLSKTTKQVQKLQKDFGKLAFTLNTEIVAQLKQNKEAVLRQLGYIPEEDFQHLSYDDQISAKGLNRTLEKEFDTLIEYYDRQVLCGNDWYFDSFISKNGRFFIDSSGFNPQSNKKLQRFLCLPKTELVEFDTSNKKQLKLEAFALAQAFKNLGTSKHNNEVADKLLSLSLKELEELRSDILNGIDLEAKWGNYGVKGVENLSQCLVAVQHLVNRHKSKVEGKDKAVFKTWLAAENDGTTSGLAIKSVMFPSLQLIKNIFPKIGILLKPSKKGNYDHNVDYSKDLEISALKKGSLTENFHDIYETMALRLMNKWSDTKLFESNVNGLSNPFKEFLFGALQNEKLRFLTDLPRSVFDINREFQILSPLLPKPSEGGVVSKALRTLIKSPSMIFGYSSGIRNISFSTTEKIVNEIINDIMLLNRKFELFKKENPKSTLDDYLNTLTDEKERTKAESLVKTAVEVIHDNAKKFASSKGKSVEDKFVDVVQLLKTESITDIQIIPSSFNEIAFLEREVDRLKREASNHKGSEESKRKLIDAYTNSTKTLKEAVKGKAKNSDKRATPYSVMDLFYSVLIPTYCIPLAQAIEESFPDMTMLNNYTIASTYVIQNLYLVTRQQLVEQLGIAKKSAFDNNKNKDDSKEVELSCDNILNVEDFNPSNKVKITLDLTTSSITYKELDQLDAAIRDLLPSLALPSNLLETIVETEENVDVSSVGTPRDTDFVIFDQVKHQTVHSLPFGTEYDKYGEIGANRINATTNNSVIKTRSNVLTFDEKGNFSDVFFFADVRTANYTQRTSAVAPTHATDGKIMEKTLRTVLDSGFGAIPVFDAVVTSAFHAADVSSVYNNNFFDYIKSFNSMEVLTERLDNAVKTFCGFFGISVQDFEKNYVLGDNSGLPYDHNLAISRAEFKPQTYETFRYLLGDYNEELEKDRASLFTDYSGDIVITQMDGGTTIKSFVNGNETNVKTVFGGEDFTPEYIIDTNRSNNSSIKETSQEALKRHSSMSGMPTNNSTYSVFKNKMDDVEECISVLEELQKMDEDAGGIIEDKSHKEHLKSLIRKIDFKFIENNIIELHSNAGNTGPVGEFEPVNIASKTAPKGVVRVALTDKKAKTKAIELMSASTVYAHELIHAGFTFGLHSLSYLKQKKLKLELLDLYEAAHKELTWEDFMPDNYPVDLKAQYEQAAKNTYDYVFNNSDGVEAGLEEFVAYGLTYPKLIKKLKSTGYEKILVKSKTSFLNNLIQLATAVFQFAFGKKSVKDVITLAKAIKNNQLTLDQHKVLFDELDNLYFSISNATAKAKRRAFHTPLKWTETVFDLFGTGITKGNAWLVPHIKNIINRSDFYGTFKKSLVVRQGQYYKVSRVRVLTHILRHLPTSREAREFMRFSFFPRVLGVAQEGLIQTLLRDTAMLDDQSYRLEKLASITRVSEQAAKGIEDTTYSNLLEGFDNKPLTEAESKSLTRSLLYTDLSVFYDKDNPEESIEEIYKFLKDKDYREAEIEKLTLEINAEIQSILKGNKKSPKEIDEINTFIMNQLHGLARYMIEGKGSIAQVTSIRSLLDDAVLESFGIKDTHLNRRLNKDTLDKVTSLLALNRVDQSNLDITSNLSKTGITNFIINHNQIIKDRQNHLLRSGKYVRQGWYKQILDNTYEMKVAFLKHKDALEKQGYKFVAEVTTLASNEKIAIFRRPFITANRRDGAAFSFESLEKEGLSLYDAAYQMLEQEVPELMLKRNQQRLQNEVDNIHYAYLAEVRKETAKLTSAMKTKLFTEDDFNKHQSDFIPVFKHGIISDLELTLSTDIKLEQLKMSEDALLILSRMYAYHYRQETANNNNEILIEFLRNDMKNNMNLKTQTVNGKPIRYIKVAKDSTPYLAKSWALVPSELKNTSNPLYVREDWLLSLLGTPSMSLADAKLVKKSNSYVLRYTLSIMEMALKLIAHVAKRNIVLFNPAVLAGNVASNANISFATGASILEVLDKSQENFKQLRSYLDVRKALRALEHKEHIGTVTEEEKKKMALYRAKLENNPIHPLIKAGMYQSIVEDINVEDLENIGALAKMLKSSKLINKTPNYVKTILRHLYLTEGTPLHNLMSSLTTYSDLVARATEYQLQMKKAPDKYLLKLVDGEQKMVLNPEWAEYEEQVLFKIRNYFINYDKPVSSIEKYLNDMGLVMFTKFFKNIQRVITQEMLENPIGTLLFIVEQMFLINSEDIFEQNIFNKNYESLLYSPWDNFTSAIIPVPVQTMLK